MTTPCRAGSFGKLRVIGSGCGVALLDRILDLPLKGVGAITSEDDGSGQSAPDFETPGASSTEGGSSMLLFTCTRAGQRQQDAGCLSSKLLASRQNNWTTQAREYKD